MPRIYRRKEQETSYEAQVSYYTEKIKSNPNWKLAGIYADDGKSATDTKKRDNFNAMIEDCMAGKIDMVMTKSVSRFARNTVDSLQNIRKLKEKNIAVFFEKEEILYEVIMTAINSVVENRGEFVGAFRENVIRVIGSYSTRNVPTEYGGQIERLQAEMLALIEENARHGAVTEDFDERYKVIFRADKRPEAEKTGGGEGAENG